MESQQLLEAGKGREMDSPLEPTEDVQSRWHFDVSPFWISTLQSYKNKFAF